MDIQTLSQQLLTSLAPFLPYLLKMGEKAAEEAAKKLGAEAWKAFTKGGAWPELIGGQR